LDFDGDQPLIDEQNPNQSPEEQQEDMNENENGDQPPIDEQIPNQSSEEQQEDMNENENGDQPLIRFHSYLLVVPLETGLDFVPHSEVDLHFRFHSYFLVALLETGLSFVHQSAVLLHFRFHSYFLVVLLETKMEINLRLMNKFQTSLQRNNKKI
jgi:hypothetical protein